MAARLRRRFQEARQAECKATMEWWKSVRWSEIRHQELHAAITRINRLLSTLGMRFDRHEEETPAAGSFPVATESVAVAESADVDTRSEPAPITVAPVVSVDSAAAAQNAATVSSAASKSVTANIASTEKGAVEGVDMGSVAAGSSTSVDNVAVESVAVQSGTQKRKREASDALPAPNYIADARRGKKKARGMRGVVVPQHSGGGSFSEGVGNGVVGGSGGGGCGGGGGGCGGSGFVCWVLVLVLMLVLASMVVVVILWSTLLVLCRCLPFFCCW